MKEILIPVITGTFIYFRKLDYYKSIPRGNLIASALIALWTWLVITHDPWFIIVGLVLLNLFGIHHKLPEQRGVVEYPQPLG